MTRMSAISLSAVVVLLAACAQQPAPPPLVTQATPPVQAASAEESALPSPDEKWDVTKLGCENWIDASDDDRAAVGMFYYGWLAGRRGLQEVRPVNIQPNLRRVLDFCAEHRAYTIVSAFQKALAPMGGAHGASGL